LVLPQRVQLEQLQGPLSQEQPQEPLQRAQQGLVWVRDL
jgi:hypothetical protein